jgi:hypothetical protein
VRNYPDTGPAPPVSVAGPGIASALGGDGGPLGDALDEALLASDLVAQNPDDITEEQAPVVARECLRRLVAAGESSPRDACRELPILAEGVEGGEATDLEIDALAANPYWVLLHYSQRANNQWYASEPECAGEVGSSATSIRSGRRRRAARRQPEECDRGCEWFPRRTTKATEPSTAAS